jgi:hypothetical protein
MDKLIDCYINRFNSSLEDRLRTPRMAVLPIKSSKLFSIDVHRALFHAHFRYFGLIVCCLDRGETATQACSRKHMEQWNLDQEKKRPKRFASEIDELDKEADRLADMLEEHMNEG